MARKTITIVTPCYNESQNIKMLYDDVRRIASRLPQYHFKHLFIDNDSTDGTQQILRNLAAHDNNVQVIFNARNFGQIRSPYHALFQAEGDAAIMIVADLQEPPALIANFIQEWEKGYKMVLGVKTQADESPVMFFIRKLYYAMVNQLSDTRLVKNFNGFALYDRKIIDILKSFDDPYPYVRGLISEIGFEKSIVTYTQNGRRRGVSKNNFLSLYDYAMLGLTTHTKLPLRVATLAGFALSLLSMMTGLFYLVFKLLYWDHFPSGTAPLLVGLCFSTAIQLFFIGLIGEYILSILTHVRKIPMVVEKERLNFKKDEAFQMVKA